MKEKSSSVGIDRRKVTRNFQITIPSWIREKLGIKEGDVLEIELRGDEIIIRKPRNKRPRIKLGRSLSVEEIEEIIERGLRSEGGN